MTSTAARFFSFWIHSELFSSFFPFFLPSLLPPRPQLPRFDGWRCWWNSLSHIKIIGRASEISDSRSCDGGDTLNRPWAARCQCTLKCPGGRNYSGNLHYSPWAQFVLPHSPLSLPSRRCWGKYRYVRQLLRFFFLKNHDCVSKTARLRYTPRFRTVTVFFLSSKTTFFVHLSSIQSFLQSITVRVCCSSRCDAITASCLSSE